MKALFIGGTGTISTSISKLAIEQGVELYLLNRGTRSDRVPKGAHVIQADIHQEDDVSRKIAAMEFDVVADFIAFTPEHVQRDYRLFAEKTKQYIFISSASAYQAPLQNPVITESTPLCNPYWKYSQDKIACEDYLMKQYREQGFPITIIRPSHTFDDTALPAAVDGVSTFPVIERIRQGKKVIVPGDGTSLWTVTYSPDFAKGFVGIMGNVHAIGEAYHITSDESLTWNQIYEVIGSALGVKPQIVSIPSQVLAQLEENYRGALLGDKANSVIFDNTKIKRAVPDFVASTRFDQAVPNVLEYIYSHPECQTKDPEFDQWCDTVIDAYETMVQSLPKLNR